MKFNVPSKYNAKYLMPRKRNHEDVTLFGTFPVEIREVSTVEAPLVHIVGETPPGIGAYGVVVQARYQMIAGNPIEIRSVEGELYKQLVSLDDFLEQLEKPFESDENVFGRANYGGISGGVSKSKYETSEERYTSFGQFEMAKKLEGVRDVKVNSDEVSDALQNYANDLLIIDGFVYERTVEPVLSVQLDDKSVYLRLCESRDFQLAKFRSHVTQNRQASGLLFGLDEYDRAVAEAQMMADRLNLDFDNRIDLKMVSEWEVEFRADMDNVYEHASIFEFYARSMVNAMDERLALAWYDLSEALQNHHQPTKEMFDALRTVASTQVDDIINRSETGQLYFKESGVYVSAEKFVENLDGVKEVLRMWDNRSQTALEWFDTSLQSSPTYRGSERAWEIVDCRTLRAIAMEYDADLTSFMTAALEGNGNVIVVSPIDRDAIESKVVALVDLHEGEPRICNVATRHRSAITPEQKALILDHVSNALEMKREFELEMSLDINM